jgi:hypothetical protein
MGSLYGVAEIVESHGSLPWGAFPLTPDPTIRYPLGSPSGDGMSKRLESWLRKNEAAPTVGVVVVIAVAIVVARLLGLME